MNARPAKPVSRRGNDLARRLSTLIDHSIKAGLYPSQKALAEHLGLSASAFSMIRSGQIKPQPATLRTLIRAVAPADADELLPKLAELAGLDVAAVHGAGVLRVAGVDQPPFSAFTDGQWTGLTVELLRQVARVVRLDIEFVPSKQRSWTEALALLGSGGADVASAPAAPDLVPLEEDGKRGDGLIRTPERTLRSRVLPGLCDRLFGVAASAPLDALKRAVNAPNASGAAWLFDARLAWPDELRLVVARPSVADHYARLVLPHLLKHPPLIVPRDAALARQALLSHPMSLGLFDQWLADQLVDEKELFYAPDREAKGRTAAIDSYPIAFAVAHSRPQVLEDLDRGLAFFERYAVSSLAATYSRSWGTSSNVWRDYFDEGLVEDPFTRSRLAAARSGPSSFPVPSPSTTAAVAHDDGFDDALLSYVRSAPVEALGAQFESIAPGLSGVPEFLFSAVVRPEIRTIRQANRSLRISHHRTDYIIVGKDAGSRQRIEGENVSGEPAMDLLLPVFGGATIRPSELDAHYRLDGDAEKRRPEFLIDKERFKAWRCSLGRILRGGQRFALDYEDNWPNAMQEGADALPYPEALYYASGLERLSSRVEFSFPVADVSLWSLTFGSERATRLQSPTRAVGRPMSEPAFEFSTTSLKPVEMLVLFYVPSLDVAL